MNLNSIEEKNSRSRSGKGLSGIASTLGAAPTDSHLQEISSHSLLNVCKQLGDLNTLTKQMSHHCPIVDQGCKEKVTLNEAGRCSGDSKSTVGHICQADRAVLLIKADSSTMEGMEFWPGIPAIPETCQGSLTGHGICLAAGTPRDLLIWDLSVSCNLVWGHRGGGRGGGRWLGAALRLGQ